jgi:hypothetical protein
MRQSLPESLSGPSLSLGRGNPTAASPAADGDKTDSFTTHGAITALPPMVRSQGQLAVHGARDSYSDPSRASSMAVLLRMCAGLPQVHGFARVKSEPQADVRYCQNILHGSHTSQSLALFEPKHRHQTQLLPIVSRLTCTPLALPGPPPCRHPSCIEVLHVALWWIPI